MFQKQFLGTLSYSLKELNKQKAKHGTICSSIPNLHLKGHSAKDKRHGSAIKFAVRDKGYLKFKRSKKELIAYPRRNDLIGKQFLLNLNWKDGYFSFFPKI